MKQSDFRRWLNEKWIEHFEEVQTWECRMPEYSSDQYFNKYKWWLRTVYKAEKRGSR